MERKYQEVSPKRLAEYRAIRRKVDAKAKRLACKEHGLPAKYYGADMMFQFWEHKKRILKEEYHMVWRSDGDLHPDRLY